MQNLRKKIASITLYVLKQINKTGNVCRRYLFSFLPKTPDQFFSFLGALKQQVICGTLFSDFGDEAIPQPWRYDHDGERRRLMKQQLISRIENKTAVIGIIGLGYVGLPLAIRFAEAVVSQSIEPESSADKQKLVDTLTVLSREDPTFTWKS